VSAPSDNDWARNQNPQQATECPTLSDSGLTLYRGTSGERDTYPNALPVSRVLLHGSGRLRYLRHLRDLRILMGWVGGKFEIRNPKFEIALAPCVMMLRREMQWPTKNPNTTS